MPEEKALYNLEKAQEEAEQLQDLVGEKGSGEDYSVANDLIEEEKLKSLKLKIDSHLKSYFEEIFSQKPISDANRHYHFILKLQQENNIPPIDYNSEPLLQETIKNALLFFLDNLKINNLQSIARIIHIPEDVYTEQRFQETALRSAKRILFSYISQVKQNNIIVANFYENYIKPVEWLFKKCKLDWSEIEKDSNLQTKAKDALYNSLVLSEWENFRDIKSHLKIPYAIYNQPEFIEAAKKVVLDLLYKHLNQSDHTRTEKKRSNIYLNHARSFQSEFKIPSEEVESSPDFQERVRSELLNSLQWANLDDFYQVKKDFNISDDIFNQDDFKNAAKIAVINKLTSYFHSLNYIGSQGRDEDAKLAQSILAQFNLEPQSINLPPELLDQLKQKLLSYIEVRNIELIDKVANYFFIQDKIYHDLEFQEAAKKSVIEGLKSYLDRFVQSNEYLQEILTTKNKFNLDDLPFQEISHQLILDNLKSGRVDNVFKIQEIFSIPREELKSPEFINLAEQSLVPNFECGNRIGIESIKDVFLPELDTEAFAREQYQKCLDDQDWNLVVKLKTYSDECLRIFQDFLSEQKTISQNTDLPFSERQKALDVLAGLAKNGELSLMEEFRDILGERSKQKEIPESKWGLDSLQETAFYTLMRLDNSDSNQALFELLLEGNTNPTIKSAILKKLTRNGSNFSNSQFREDLHAWLYSPTPKKTDWRDLEFIEAIQKIPSKELQDQSLKSFHIVQAFDLSKISLSEIWEKECPNIPQNTLLQALEFEYLSSSENLLEKLDHLFESVRKSNRDKENLLGSITGVLTVNLKFLELLGQQLTRINFGLKDDAVAFSTALKLTTFLDRIEDISHYHQSEDYYDDNYDERDYTQEKTISPEVLATLTKEVNSLDELVNLLKEACSQRFQEILPHPDITQDKIEAIEKAWGSLEPIFTYLGRYPSLKEYIAEIVAHLDSEENWKNWRYDLEVQVRKDQVGHLSDEQLEAWKGDYFVEVGDLMIAETGSEKPAQIRNILRTAILEHGHIYNPERGQYHYEIVQRSLEETLTKIIEEPEKLSDFISEKNDLLSVDAKKIDAIINFNNLPKIREGLELITSAGEEIAFSAKIKNTINFLAGFLPVDLKKELLKNNSKLEEEKKILQIDLLKPEMKQGLEEWIQEVEAQYLQALESDIWEKFQLNKEQLKKLDQFYQKRQELKSAIDLLRLLNLSNKLIATNKITENEGKKTGETITGVLERLKKYFKDSPLLLDLQNVEFVLREKIDYGEKRRLAMIFTDNSQMLWQAGKYPLGNGSCQHYAEGSHASHLMGYVGDANCKVAYLVDLNRLPSSQKQQLEEQGFEEVKALLPKQDLLEASLARSIIKIAKDNSGQPVILLEPTYTIIYKSDNSMDKYFNIFLGLMLAEPMKAKMARGEGSDSIEIGESLSPEGQYEDTYLSAVKYISYATKPTQEDIEVMERIRSSR